MNLDEELLRIVATETGAYVFTKLVSEGANVNITNGIGQTPLMIAAAFNENPLVVKTLIKLGAEINKSDNEGNTALILALQYNRNIEIIKTLVDFGAFIDAHNDMGLCPLIIAIKNQDEAAVKFLIEHNVDLNVSDNFGNSPYNLAIKSNFDANLIKILKNNSKPKIVKKNLNIPNEVNINLLNLVNLSKERRAEFFDKQLTNYYENSTKAENQIEASIKLEKAPLKKVVIADNKTVNEEIKFRFQSFFNNKKPADFENLEFPVSPQKFTKLDTNIINNQDIKETFNDELKGILDEVSKLIPAWKDDINNTHILLTIRRGFHTIKGSGKMLGFEALAECAWQHEYLLNSVRDSHISINNSIISLVEDTINLFKALFVNGQFIEERILLIHAELCKFFIEYLFEAFSVSQIEADDYLANLYAHIYGIGEISKQDFIAQLENKSIKKAKVNLEKETDNITKEIDNKEKEVSVSIFEALEELDISKIKNSILKHKDEINNINTLGQTPLIVACLIPKMDYKIIKLLIDNGADINFQDYEGNTALHYAISRNYVDFSIIECLVNAKARIDITNYEGKTSLDLIISSRDYDRRTKIRELFYKNYQTEKYQEYQNYQSYENEEITDEYLAQNDITADKNQKDEQIEQRQSKGKNNSIFGVNRYFFVFIILSILFLILTVINKEGVGPLILLLLAMFLVSAISSEILTAVLGLFIREKNIQIYIFYIIVLLITYFQLVVLYL